MFYIKNKSNTMKNQTFQVRDLKNKIAATMRLLALGFKRYITQLLDLEGELTEALSDQLFQLFNEDAAQYQERVRKLMFQAANKKQMVLGQIDTFMSLSTTIYKRLPHPIKGWSDTKLGELRIETDGRIFIWAGRGKMLVPTLDEAMTRFESHYQSTQISWV